MIKKRTSKTDSLVVPRRQLFNEIIKKEISGNGFKGFLVILKQLLIFVYRYTLKKMVIFFVATKQKKYTNHSDTNFQVKNTPITDQEMLPKISVITSINRLQYIDRLINNYGSQSFPNKELILIINSDTIAMDEVKESVNNLESVQVVHQPEHISLGQCLNTAIGLSSGKFISKMDDDDFYSNDYLFNSYNTITETKADLIGKPCYFCYLEERDLTVLVDSMLPELCFVKRFMLAGTTITWRKEINESARFHHQNTGEDTGFLRDVYKHNFKVFATDRYGYLKWRSSKSADYTWQLQDNEFIFKSKEIFRGFDLTKCF